MPGKVLQVWGIGFRLSHSHQAGKAPHKGLGHYEKSTCLVEKHIAADEDIGRRELPKCFLGMAEFWVVGLTWV